MSMNNRTKRHIIASFEIKKENDKTKTTRFEFACSWK